MKKEDLKRLTMNEETLDEGFSIITKVNNKEGIKSGLKKAGISTFYEHKNGTIVVEQSDAVRLAIHYENLAILFKYLQLRFCLLSS